MKKFISTFILSLVLICNGCGSIGVRTEFPAEQRAAIYPGVVWDIDSYAKFVNGGDKRMSQKSTLENLGAVTITTVAIAIDVPLSFILDTILLPVDILQPEKPADR